VCPYCGGKGYVSVPVDLPADDHPRNRQTWVRKPCPLCGGQGSISGDDSALPRVPVNGHPNSWIGPADISALSRRFGSCRPSDRFQIVVLKKRESWPVFAEKRECGRFSAMKQLGNSKNLSVNCERLGTGIQSIGEVAPRSGTKQWLLNRGRKDEARSFANYYGFYVTSSSPTVDHRTV
jgi:hypothetical protein